MLPSLAAHAIPGEAKGGPARSCTTAQCSSGISVYNTPEISVTPMVRPAPCMRFGRRRCDPPPCSPPCHDALVPNSSPRGHWPSDPSKRVKEVDCRGAYPSPTVGTTGCCPHEGVSGEPVLLLRIALAWVGPAPGATPHLQLRPHLRPQGDRRPPGGHARRRRALRRLPGGGGAGRLGEARPAGRGGGQRPAGAGLRDGARRRRSRRRLLQGHLGVGGDGARRAGDLAGRAGPLRLVGRRRRREGVARRQPLPAHRGGDGAPLRRDPVGPRGRRGGVVDGGEHGPVGGQRPAGGAAEPLRLHPLRRLPQPA